MISKLVFVFGSLLEMHHIFTVVSKLLLLYSTTDKTSTLKMKSFSTVRVTQRGSPALHGEEKREEGVRGDPNEMRWNQ